MSLTRDEFWSIIDRANKDDDTLRRLLEPLAQRDLLRFYRFFMEYSSDLRDELPEPGRSDYQEELTWYVVEQGKALYDDVLAHPDKLPRHQDPPRRDFPGMIARVYWERFDEEVDEADEREPWEP